MNSRVNDRGRGSWIGLAALALATLLTATVLCAQTGAPASPNAGGGTLTITPGTILPVVLRTPVSFQKAKAGQAVSGKIAQDVPLANGVKIRKGTEVSGHIVEVTPNASGTGQRLSLQFDKIYWNGQWVAMVTDLRALASWLDVMEAHVPEEAPNEGSPYAWLPTTQIGGDSVYGFRGQVMSADNPSQVVGKSVAGGVLVQPSAKEGTNCRGEVDGNNAPQALWVFSSGACGVYGYDGLSIEHAGRTDPNGTIVLASNAAKLELRDGDGMLLRVQ